MKNFVQCKTNPTKDLSGKVFGGVKVIRPIGKQYTKTVYECVCIHCGRMLKITSCNVQRNMACGCLKGGVVTHGRAGSVEYGTWNHIKDRCLNIDSPDYKGYGERGITVCDRWLKFENFMADMGERPIDKESIDRIDNNKGYSPDNCRWATRIEQNRNKRNNKFVSFKGESLCLSEWAKRAGLPPGVISKRLICGWSIEKTLTQPVRAQQA